MDVYVIPWRTVRFQLLAFVRSIQGNSELVFRSGVYRRWRTLNGIYENHITDGIANAFRAVRIGLYRELERLFGIAYLFAERTDACLWLVRIPIRRGEIRSELTADIGRVHDLFDSVGGVVLFIPTDNHEIACNRWFERVTAVAGDNPLHPKHNNLSWVAGYSLLRGRIIVRVILRAKPEESP